MTHKHKYKAAALAIPNSLKLAHNFEHPVMGGNAFAHRLPPLVIPRMTPSAYLALKARSLQRLKPLYKYVGVPPEAPEKTSYGDLDIIVAGPLRELTAVDVGNALGAECHVDDKRTVYCAIPSEKDGEHYQVDVNLTSEEDWEREMFSYSYGDLGMILGLLARAYGLSLGSKCLKLAGPEVAGYIDRAEFILSTSSKDILQFFGLEYSRWETGFSTIQEIFEWVALSPLFHPKTLSFRETPKREKERSDRGMYQKFLEFVRQASESGKYDDVPTRQKAQVIAEAKRVFGKEAEYEERVRARKRRIQVKRVLNGAKVKEWTGLEGKVVGDVLKAVIESVGEDDVLRMSEKEVREHVCAVAARHNPK